MVITRSQSASIFRFLDLPPEIRLMVYEHLPRSIHHHTFAHPAPSTDSTTILIRSVPVSLLRTCKQVNAEATPIVQNLARDFVLRAPPRIIERTPAGESVAMLDELSNMIGRLIKIIKEDLEPGQVPGELAHVSILLDGIIPNALKPHFCGFRDPSSESTVAKFVLQAALQLVFKLSPEKEAIFEKLPEDYKPLDLFTIECVKWVRPSKKPGPHWPFAEELHRVNRFNDQYGVAVGVAGCLYRGKEDGGEPPHEVRRGCQMCGWVVPTLGKMSKEEWESGWLASGKTKLE